MGAGLLVKPATDLIDFEPGRGVPSTVATDSIALSTLAAARHVDEAAAGLGPLFPQPPRKRSRAPDCQSRKAIMRLLHAQPRWVVWDLPQQSMLRLRAQTYDRHVGKSDEELKNVLRRNYIVGATADWFQRAEGSFADVLSARNFVNRVLEENRAEVEIVANGKQDGAILQSSFGCETGKEAFRPDYRSAPVIRNTHSVRIVIKPAPGTHPGYRIHSAFPTGEDAKGQAETTSQQVPEEFCRLCAHAYQGSHEEYASESEWMANAVGSLCGEQKQVVLGFLDALLCGRNSDADIERVWRSTTADYGFSPGGHRIFLNKIRDVIRMVLSDSFW
jgi:hypothetical protein